MIRKTYNHDKWLLTPQPEHARLSGLMAASWVFPGGKPYDEAIKAVVHHDDGWKESEADPPLNRDGDPANFDEMPIQESAAIWRRSVALQEEAGRPLAAALIASHFNALVESADMARVAPRDAAAMGRFIAEQRVVIRRLKEAAAAGEGGAARLENFERDLRLLQVCDLLSLLLCTDFAGETVIPEVPFLRDGNSIKVKRKGKGLSLTLHPLPFKKNLRDHLTSWLVPREPYEDSAALKKAMLGETGQVTNEVHLGGG